MAKISKLKNAINSLRPTVKIVGNSLDFDSIYNHSIPKKLKPKKQYADWFEENILNAPEHMPGEGSSRKHLNRWANATDEGIENYLKDIRKNYSSASADAIEEEIRGYRQKAINIVEESKKKFNAATKSSINSNLYIATTTLENAKLSELPISREKASEIVQNTVNKVYQDLGLTDNLLVNTISGNERNGNVIHRGVHSTDEIGVYLDGVYEAASIESRKRQISELRNKYKDMNEDDFYEMIHNQPDLINPLTAEEYEKKLIETASHETRHHWQQEQNPEMFFDGDRKIDRSSETYDEYYEQSIEKDARQYADDFVNKNADEIINGTSASNYSYNRNLEQGDTINLNTGDIEKADGTIVKEDGTIIPPPETNPLQTELEEEINQAEQQRQQTSQPEVQQQVEQRQYSSNLSPEEQAAVDRANAQWRADNEARYADMDKQIENMYKADDIVFGTPEQILDPNYVSSFDPLEETIESTIDAAEETINQTSKSTPRGRTGRQTGRYAKQRNAERQSTKNRGRSGNAKGKTGSTKSIDQLHQEANQRKWATEQYAKQQAEQLNKYKQTYEDILDDWKKTSGDFSGNLDNRNLKMPDRLINNGSNSHQMYTEAKNYNKYVEDANTDYYRERYTDGSYTMDEQVFKYTEGEGVDGKTVLKNEGELINNADEYAQQLDDTLKNARSTMSPEDFEAFRNGYTPETTIRHNGNTPELNQRRVLRNSHLIESPAKFGAMDTIMSGVNILGAVGDYKAARRKGHGVISSAVRAGTQFAVYEALGAWALPVSLLQQAPGAVIKGADILYKENRRMNSAANFQVFGDAQFMDTQQLATMRQSGMEMAKMSQYNLQQTLMGNEATYLHR